MNSFLEDSTERISRLSNESRHDTLINEKKWEWGFLRVSNANVYNNYYLQYVWEASTYFKTINDIVLIKFNIMLNNNKILNYQIYGENNVNKSNHIDILIEITKHWLYIYSSFIKIKLIYLNC